MASTLGVMGANLVSDRGDGGLLRIIGVALLLLSPLLFVPPFIVLARAGKPAAGQTYTETSRLVRRGPYRLVRHPQYLGYIFLNLGLMLIAQTWVAVGFASLSIGLLIALAVEEEHRLRERFGDEYASHCQEVPRLNVIAGLARWLRPVFDG